MAKIWLSSKIYPCVSQHKLSHYQIFSVLLHLHSAPPRIVARLDSDKLRHQGLFVQIK